MSRHSSTNEREQQVAFCLPMIRAQPSSDGRAPEVDGKSLNAFQVQAEDSVRQRGGGLSSFLRRLFCSSSRRSRRRRKRRYRRHAYPQWYGQVATRSCHQPRHTEPLNYRRRRSGESRYRPRYRGRESGRRRHHRAEPGLAQESVRVRLVEIPVPDSLGNVLQSLLTSLR